MSLLGLLGLVWGTALALPALGNASFMIPAAMDLGSASIVKAAVVETLMGPGMLLGNFAASLYTLGPVLLGISLWKTGHYPGAGIILFAAHGAFPSIGFTFFPLLLAGWAMLIVSGSLFAARYKK